MKREFTKKICPAVLVALILTMTFFISNVQQTFADDEEGSSESDMANVSTDGAPDTAALYFSAGEEDTDSEYDLSENEGLYTLTNLVENVEYSITQNDSNWWVLSGLSLTSGDYTFNGIVATGEDTTVVLEDSSIDLNVDDVLEDSDATGGSAIAVDDGATFYVSNSDLTVEGAGRYVTSAYSDGTLIVNDSTIQSEGNLEGNTDVISDPASNEALLISGTARANFSIGATDTYYFNSECIAEGWAALSTDSATGDGLDLYAYNTIATAEDGGYATYADTDCRVWLYGSDLESAEIGAIISKTGEIHVYSGSDADEDLLQYMDEDGEETTEGTTITGGRNAVMLHAPDMMGEGVSASSTAVLEVVDSTLATDDSLETTFDYAEAYGDEVAAYIDYISGAAILVKSTSANITLDDATIDSYSDTILMTVINADSMGNFLEDGDGDDVDPVSVTMTDMDVSGNILHMDYQREMTVTLSNTTWSGQIVSGTMEDWNALWSDYDADDMNWVVDTEWTTVYGASLTLTDNSTWTVTDESTLSSLTVEDGSTINGTVTVDGDTVDIVAGTTYEGTIVVTPLSDSGSDDSTTDDTDEGAGPVDSDGDGVPDDMPEIPDSDDGSTDDTDDSTTDDTDDSTTDDTDDSTTDDTDDSTTDDTDEVTITSGDATVTGDIPDDCIFSYEEFDADSDEYEEVAEILAEDDYDDLGTFVVYDLDLVDAEGVTLELTDDGVEVTMPVPSELSDADDIAVYVMEEDGTLTELTVTLNDDGTITFTAPHFSTYVFAEVTSSDSDSSASTDDDSDSSSSSSDSATSTSSSDSATSTVSTGDSSNVILWISLSTCVLIAAGGASYYNNKKKLFD